MPRRPSREPIDTTGAGDLLAAAYIWAELRGAEPADRLRWSVLYASLAVNTPSGIGGALDGGRPRPRRHRARPRAAAARRRLHGLKNGGEAA